MTLEFEKLTPEIERMAQGAYQRAQHRNILLDEAEHRLHHYATAWDIIERRIALAQGLTDEKFFRAARPVEHDEPLDAVIDAPPAPPQATITASDGSQILPDRHAAYLYSVINIGVITFFHGQGRAPAVTTFPQLDYPNGAELDEDAEDAFVENGAIVNLRRDLAEIQSLARATWENRHEPRPALALLDQRLLYWPIGGDSNAEGKRILDGWQAAMTELRTLGSLLAGYIARPGKSSVLTMLQAMDIDRPDFDAATLTAHHKQPGPLDADLFRRLLREPGQRSKVFADISQQNNRFAERDPQNEVCFFFFNPGRSGRQIARVDIPLWVATDPTAVATVHALVYDQCLILGDYPYILARADEEAVIGSRDHQNLDLMIDNAMTRYGVSNEITAKQSGKNVARAGRTRHGM